MKKIVIVGQAPSEYGTGRPIEGRIGARLAKLCGISSAEYLVKFERVNLIDRFPGKNGKGDAFPLDEAVRVADGLKARLKGRKAILLGRNVARAFGVAGMSYLEWIKVYGFGIHKDLLVAVMPHPSGINRWWNDEVNVERAKRFMERL